MTRHSTPETSPALRLLAETSLALAEQADARLRSTLTCSRCGGTGAIVAMDPSGEPLCAEHLETGACIDWLALLADDGWTDAEHLEAIR